MMKVLRDWRAENAAGSGVREVFGFQPFNLAATLDDDWHIVFLVTKHGVSNTSGEGVVYGLLVLSHDASNVFARVSLHAAPWRLTVSQTSLS